MASTNPALHLPGRTSPGWILFSYGTFLLYSSAVLLMLLLLSRLIPCTGLLPLLTFSFPSPFSLCVTSLSFEPLHSVFSSFLSYLFLPFSFPTLYSYFLLSLLSESFFLLLFSLFFILLLVILSFPLFFVYCFCSPYSCLILFSFVLFQQQCCCRDLLYAVCLVWFCVPLSAPVQHLAQHGCA